ncbi:sterile alpha motif domain-containing protein 7 [Ambystoma mexicanum]|uniref:sterile alpha motif domain-containing protein 7 n=1 Tax=Ambystoma mexicanum TaxID=8296 RepID=UPI0037E72EF0
MTPRDHLRKVSLLGEQSSMEEKHLYRFASCMSTGELRQRQEALMRNQMMAAHPQVIGPAQQQRMPAIPSPFEARFLDRDVLPASDMITPNDARQMHMASHLGGSVPGHVNMLSNRVYPGPGYGFVQPDSMEAMARRQELVQKQNMARMEMEMNVIYQQKEIEKAHRKGLLDLEAAFIYPGIQVNPIPFRGRHRLAEGHLPNDMYVHQNTLEDLHGGAMLVANSPYPPIATLQRERGRRQGRRAGNHKTMEGNVKSQSEDKIMDHSSATLTADEEKTDMRESDTEACGKSDPSKITTDLSTTLDKGSRECEQGQRKSCGLHNTPSETSICRNGNEKDMNNQCAIFEDKFSYPTTLPLSSMPYGFPATGNNLLPTASGAHSLYLNGDDLSSADDIRKWTVDDVHNFVFNLPGCSEYAQVFKEHAIDGETLPLLTEEHLLDMMGLKLGPALKVRSQVSRRLGHVFYMMNLPLSLPLQQAPAKAPDQQSEMTSPVNGNDNSAMLSSPSTQESEMGKTGEAICSQAKDNQCDMVATQAEFQMPFLKS